MSLWIDKRPAGRIMLPASKSISHRALIAAALAGSGQVLSPASNADTAATLDCLRALGATFEKTGSDICVRSGLTRPNAGTVMDCGESGSTLRFLIPLAGALGASVRFRGRGRLMERPMDVYERCLRGMRLERTDGMLTSEGQLLPGRFELPGDVSSQFVTGLLFALPLLNGDSELVMTSPLQSGSYVDLTLDCLKDFGLVIDHSDPDIYRIPGGQHYQSRNYRVEADYSAAAFFLTAGALGCDVSCGGLSPDSLQGDRAYLSILEQAGARIIWDADGFLQAAPGPLGAVTVDVSDTPDLVPPMAVLLCFCPGESVITGAARLRIKECDRLAAVTEELNRLGARITEGPDYLKIVGVPSLTGGSCHAHNDHRIAMMVAVAALMADGPVSIDEPGCVAKSYPAFWSDFMKV